MRSIHKVVVLGGNGVMGAASGAMFAAAGVPTVLLARTADKAAAGVARANQLTKGAIAPGMLSAGTYADDLALALDGADLVLEAVAEDPATKRGVFALVDQMRDRDALVATITSGLSVAELCDGCSPSFKAHFLGIHLFNPPTAISGCELVAQPATDPGAVAIARDFLTSVCGRQVVECADRPAFAGNRLGFKVLNEAAQLAEEHGVAFVDRVLGPHTGRALAPLATIDLVGWDVHAAIVDNLRARVRDWAAAAFATPRFMLRGITRGTLGRKSKELGGFYRDKGALALDPSSGEYRAVAPVASPLADAMCSGFRASGCRGAMAALCDARGLDADIARRVLLGYVAYGLGLVGEVVAHPRDIDRIMGFGFAWAPPGMLADAIGPRRAIAMIEKLHLPVPDVLVAAAHTQRPIFAEPGLDASRFFALPT